MAPLEDKIHLLDHDTSHSIAPKKRRFGPVRGSARYFVPVQPIRYIEVAPGRSNVLNLVPVLKPVPVSVLVTVFDSISTDTVTFMDFQYTVSNGNDTSCS
eukprot:SAG11_NODE_6285_length_1344_cov_1.121285_1_plen_100_part_00